MGSALGHIASELLVEENQLRKQIDEGARRIKIVKIPKKGGSFRKLHIPPRIFRLIQYVVIQELQNLAIDSCATAYFKGCSPANNARRHRGGKYLVKVDFSSFFTSLRARDVSCALKLYEDHEFATRLADAIGKDEHLRVALFVENRLGTGFPISPTLSNIVARPVDCAISERLESMRDWIGDYTYTRYADDIAISYEAEGVGRKIVGNVQEVLKDLSSPSLRLNQSKTSLGTKHAGSFFITGFRITPDGRVRLSRKYRDHVRLLVSLYSQGRLDDMEVAQLFGHLNYVRFADTQFLTYLYKRFSGEVQYLLGRHDDQ